jgi:hypothetical protein
MEAFKYVHLAFYFSPIMKLIFHVSIFASIICLLTGKGKSLAVQRSNSAEKNSIYAEPDIERRTVVLEEKKGITRTKLLERLDTDSCNPGILCSGTLPLSRLILIIDTNFYFLLLT